MDFYFNTVSGLLLEYIDSMVKELDVHGQPFYSKFNRWVSARGYINALLSYEIVDTDQSEKLFEIAEKIIFGKVL